MKAVILSGISGAGKSSWIKSQPWVDDCVVHSADHYFTKGSQSYQFDASKLDEAHGECLRHFIHGVQTGCRARSMKEIDFQDAVEVVDNTNLSVEEIAPYYSVARAYGYEVELVTLYCEPQLAASRNTHNVPLSSVLRMSNKLTDRRLPSFWNLKHSMFQWDAQRGDWKKVSNAPRWMVYK